jgi:long-subunit fatty acid transport protein
VQQLITGGFGNYTISQVQMMGYISSAQRATLEGGLANLGWTPAQIAAMNMNTVKTRFELGAAYLNEKAAETADTEVDTKQTGAGWTPIFGINISPIENLNIGLKYEHKTTLKLTNDTRKSDAGLDFLKDGEEVNSDLPGFIAAGISYRFSDKFLASVSFNEYLDKGVDWGNNIYDQERTIDHNSWELALGFQYNISEDFAISLGGMQSTTGVSEQYQSDFSYSNTSNTGGLGFQWNILPNLAIDAGMLFTVYKDAEKAFYRDADKTILDYTDTYDKKNIGFAIGLSYSITK